MNLESGSTTNSILSISNQGGEGVEFSTILKFIRKHDKFTWHHTETAEVCSYKPKHRLQGTFKTLGATTKVEINSEIQNKYECLL